MNCPFTKIKNLFCKNHGQVAVVNLSGVIGKGGKLDQGINIENTNPLLEKAFATKGIKAVAINVNSPGGSPVQSELIFKRIRELSIEKKIPVFTFAQDVAASGGYFILLAGDEMYGSDFSIIGSIGVIFSGFGFEELIKKIGVQRRIYTEGKNKAILDPFSPENPENIAILKAAQKDIYDGFTALVKGRRGDKLKKPDDQLFTGAFWSGKTSKEIGLIDEVSDMRTKMKEKFGDKIKFINIEPKKKGMIKELLSGRAESLGAGFADAAIDKIIDKGIWSRFKL